MAQQSTPTGDGLQQPPPQQQRQSLRALYERVKAVPLEVVAIETTGIAPVAPPPSSSGSSSDAPESAPPSATTKFEEVPLRTRASVLDRELAAVLAADPATLEGVHQALERAVLNLRATEAFDDVLAEIDGEPQVSSSWVGGAR
jgi:hypothetical protein